MPRTIGPMKNSERRPSSDATSVPAMATPSVCANAIQSTGGNQSIAGAPPLAPTHQRATTAAAAVTIAIRRYCMNATSRWSRSEEHTSELQSRENLVCRLLLEKKKKKTKTQEDRTVVDR